MRHILAVLLLALCLCGCSYAEENPFQKATEEISSQIDIEKAEYAAQELQKFYESGETTADLRTIDDGLGGILVFDAGAGGVYTLDYNTQTYNGIMEGLIKSYVLVQYLFTGLILILFVMSLILIHKELDECKKTGSPKAKKMLILCLSLLSIASLMGLSSVWTDTASEKKESPEAVRAVLEFASINDRAKFYPRNEVKDLLQEYAAKYKAAEA